MLQCHGKTFSYLVIHFVYKKGDSDPVVKYPLGVLTSQFLSSINPKNHCFKSYPGLEHSADAKVIILFLYSYIFIGN